MKILLRLLTSLRPYRWQVLGLLVCLLVVTAASLVTPSIIRSVIDDGIAQNNASAMLSAGLTIVGVGLIRSAFNFAKRYLGEWLINRTGYDYRNALYDKIQRLSFGYHDQAQTGQLMSRCTEDVSALSRFVGQGAVELINVAMLLAGIIFLLFRENVALTLIGLGPLIVLAGLTYYLGNMLGPLFLKVDQALGDISSALQENLSGAQVVRAFAREDFEKEKFALSNRNLFNARVKIVGTWGFFMPTMTVLVMASTALILWFGGNRVVGRTLTLGDLVAFNAYLILLAAPVGQLAFVVNSASEAVAGGQRIFEILDLPEEIASPVNARQLPPLGGRVTFESVSFSYRGERRALHDVSFEAQPNQVIALIGPTGSGKTSLINLIPRFYDATAGRVLVDGYDVRLSNLKSLRSQIGIVLQTSLLFSTTIRENIAYGRLDATEEEVVAAAKAARAHDFILSFPDGYNTAVGERGVTLSGGQRQRVAIARALLMNPRILILDDSTSSVDTQTEHLIQQALAELMKGRTTFVIAQRLSTVKRADQIFVLDGGRIVQRGTHDSLLAEGGLYKEIYDLQLKDQEKFRKEMLFLDALPETVRAIHALPETVGALHELPETVGMCMSRDGSMLVPPSKAKSSVRPPSFVARMRGWLPAAQ
ncbi:MAG: ABC transporter ATP-binding protein [Chloroflexi bacterium]|nr:ABC transporter ATP-binding protein [Chloroflexota bacterium]